MFKWFTNLWDKWFGSALAPTLPEPYIVSCHIEPDAIPIAPPPPPAVFHSLGNVIDHLDKYFEWLAMVKRCAPAFYKLYSRLGMTLLPEIETTFNNKPVTPPSEWPTFLGISLSDKLDSEDGVMPRLLFFRKVNVPRGAVVIKGAVFYESLIIFTEQRLPGLCFPVYFYVGIENDGTIRPLKGRVMSTQKIKHRHGKAESYINHSTMNYDKRLVEWYEATDVYKRGESIEHLINSVFLSSLNLMLDSEKGVQVNVTSVKGLVGRFAVPLNKTVSFFKDRNLSVTENGKKKKIFHAVTEHSRTYKNGKTVKVVPHFRGERHFMWKGYDIVVAVPKHHYNPLSNFTDTTIDVSELPPNEGYDEKAAGDFFKKALINDTKVIGARKDNLSC